MGNPCTECDTCTVMDLSAYTDTEKCMPSAPSWSAAGCPAPCYTTYCISSCSMAQFSIDACALCAGCTSTTEICRPDNSAEWSTLNCPVSGPTDPTTSRSGAGAATAAAECDASLCEFSSCDNYNA